MSFYVYRIYDDAGALLYIGSTKNVATRITRHRYSGKAWRHAIARVESSAEYPTRADAEVAERMAIATEAPLHNIMRYAMDTNDLAGRSAEWHRLRDAEAAARHALIQFARECHANGMSAYRIGKATGAAPDTVRKWLKED